MRKKEMEDAGHNQGEYEANQAEKAAARNKRDNEIASVKAMNYSKRKTARKITGIIFRYAWIGE